MNVVCGQCGTGYEFDDALVSERGTTVRCMQCGHQFRVHPERAKAGATERWVVRKTTGEEYIFRSLSELQRAIAHRRVLTTDSLSRDGVRFRLLSELTELESFFHAGRGAGLPSVPPGSPKPGGFARAAHDPMAITPTAAISVPMPTPRGGFATAATETMAIGQTPASGNPARQSGLTQPTGLVHPGHSQEPDGARAGAGGSGSPRRSSSSTMPVPSAPHRPASTGPNPGLPTPVVPSPAPGPSPLPGRSAGISAPVMGAPVMGAHQAKLGGAPGAGAGLPALQKPNDEKRPGPNAGQAVGNAQQLSPGRVDQTLASGVDSSGVDDRPTPAGALPRRRRQGRQSQPVEDHTLLASGVAEPSSSHLPAALAVNNEHRSGGPRWIIALVLLGGLALVAGTVGRDYFERYRESRGRVAPADTRVESFLAAGDEMFRAGDWEEARAQYEKAGALAENEPSVLQRLLQLDTARADIDWLRLRLLPKSSPDLQAVTASLQERVAKLQRRVEDLRKALTTPTPDATIAVVDALRVQGQLPAARALVQQTSGLSNEARAAYVSAMMDVSESNPDWASIVSRLKIAVSGERGLGRAQAALVYSLIGGGQFEEARQQLDVLAGFKRPSPLLPELQALLASASVPAATDNKVSAPAELVGASADSNAQPEKDSQGAGDSVLHSDDPMAEAAEARAAGELARASRLYTFALSKNPGNVAAMTGLGDVARSQGNNDIALSHYGAALRTNPNFGPAVLSCADLKWSTGDRAGAVELYRRLAGGAPARVAERIAEYENQGEKKAESPAASPPPALEQPPQPVAEVPAPPPAQPAPVVEPPTQGQPAGAAVPGPAAQNPEGQQ